jgi:hypothetical protein
MIMKKPKIIGGYQNTKLNNEDFALTPFVFLVCPEKLKCLIIRGIGLCWGHHAVYIGVGFGIPKDFPCFRSKKYVQTTNRHPLG